MSETQALFSVLKQTADPGVVDAIRDLVENGEDRALNRINLLDFSRKTGLDEEKVNFSGSGCSLGHPIAATGARMVTSAIYELRRRGGGIGVLSMCAGGGMGAAMVIEVA